MSKREGQDYAEYMRVTADERNRIVRLRDLKLTLPAVNVFDSPFRCFKVNHEWWKIIHGAVSLLLELDAWQDANDESYSGIQQILEFLEGMDCFDCDDVENCLDTSPTITLIETNIVNVTNTTIQNSDDIDTLEIAVNDATQTDGNYYPSYPVQDIEPDAACGSANYVIVKVREFIADLESASGTYATLLEAIEAYLNSVVNLIFSPFYILMAAIFSPTPPNSVLTDFDNQTDEMIEFLYCEGFDKSAFETYVRTLTNGDAIADFIACIGLGSWNQWVAIGSQDDTQDCSSIICGTYCYEWVLSSDLSGWTILAGSQSANGLDTGFYQQAGSDQHAAILVRNITGIDITRIEFEGLHIEKIYFVAGWNEEYIYSDNQGLILSNPKSNGTNDPVNVGLNVSGLTGNIQIGIRSGIKATNSGNDITASSGYMSKVRIFGNGANPFGLDNC